MITWSGFNWDVRDQGLTAPGPNRWSDQNAVVSGSELVLSVAQVAGNWCCAEVACQSHLGYGIYRWIVNTRLDDLDVNDVLGLFTYAGPAPSFNEIDIEAAHWGNAAWPGGSGTIWQNAAANARVYGEFDWTDDPPYTCQFKWEPGRITYLITDNLGATLFDWSLADGDIADAGFSDDFSVGSVPNFAKWRRFGVTPPTLLSGQLRLQSAAAGVEYAGVATARTYDLVGCTCTVKPTPAPVSGAHELSLEIVKADDTERISLAISGTWLYHGVSTALVEDRAYDPTGDAWWRIEEAEGLTTFQTSPDGTTWNTLGSVPTPTWMDDANVQIVAGHWEAEAADTDARIDNFTLVTTGTAGGALIPVPSTEKPYINYWRNLGTTPPAAKSIRLASFSWIPVGGVGLQSSQGHAAGTLTLSAPTVSGTAVLILQSAQGHGGGIVMLLTPAPPIEPPPGPIYVPRPAPEFEPLSHYKFELARSSDLGRIGELTQARGRSLQLALNRAGAFSCTLPLDDELTNYVQEVTTCIIISRDREIEWSGPIWTLTESVSAGAASLQIGAVGWLQTLDKRVVRASWNNNLAVNYVNQDAGVIALDLLARSNSDAMAAGAPVFIFPGEIEMTQPRTRSYQPWSGILGALTELTEIESGFDMVVDPVTRRLNISTRIGTDKGIIFELPGDVTQVNRQTDSGRILNFFTVYSSAGAATEVDADSVSRLGLFEEAQSLSDVVNPNILLAFAAGEIFVKSRPLRIVTFQPLAESIERPFSPRVFRDFNIGDTVRLSMHHGRMSMDRQPLRMFSFTVSFPETGGAHVGDVQTTMS